MKFIEGYYGNAKYRFMMPVITSDVLYTLPPISYKKSFENINAYVAMNELNQYITEILGVENWNIAQYICPYTIVDFMTQEILNAMFPGLSFISYDDLDLPVYSQSMEKINNVYTKEGDLDKTSTIGKETNNGFIYNANYHNDDYATIGDYVIPYTIPPLGFGQLTPTYRYTISANMCIVVNPTLFNDDGSINIDDIDMANKIGVINISISHFNSQYICSTTYNKFTSYEIIDKYNLQLWLGNMSDIPLPDDPFVPGGETTPGGGTGDFDNTSDNIDFPTSTPLSATDTGFITLFNPTLSQLKELSSYMWSSLFDIEGWKKIFADPMDAILGLSIVPVAVPSGGSTNVKVGNISTGINMTLAAQQYVDVDCGTLNINEYWGAYLDYAPFTKTEIFLPFIGIHPINVDDIMNKSVSVRYRVDILSGACIAMIKCGNSVLYSYNGQCSAMIPINSQNYSNTINGILNIAGSIGAMIATGGSSAPLNAARIGAGVSATTSLASTAVNTMKPNISRSGSLSGGSGLLGIQKPYIILTRPRQALPSEQNKFTGYPSYITVQLRNIQGFTIVEQIHLENISASYEELQEIENLLYQGVIL